MLTSGVVAALMTATTIVEAPQTEAARSGLATSNEMSPVIHQGLDVGTAPSARERLDPLRVALYGDSLSFQAQGAFVSAITDSGPANVHVHTYGGTAICDYLEQMRADAASWRPEAVVMEFSGNAFTPCMRDAADNMALSGPALVAKYAADAQEAAEIFSIGGARLYLVSYPISRAAAESSSTSWNRLNNIYESMAHHDSGVEFVDAAQAVERNGRYTDTLPCLVHEPCTGRIENSGQRVNFVRAPDGAHFCPGAQGAVDGVTGTCPVWSSGAFRYGTAMAIPVIEDFLVARAAVTQVDGVAVPPTIGPPLRTSRSR